MDDRASKRKGLVWALLALVLGVFLALGLSPLAHAIPWSWERRLGGALSQEGSLQRCQPSPEAQALLQRLVARLYPLDASEAAQPIEVRVVRDPAVNAYAALGGKITVNSGLLRQAQSPEEVAGVLAHEIGHVRHRHIMEGALVHLFTWEGLKLILGGASASTGMIQTFLGMDFTRGQETEADRSGLQRLQQAQVDTRGLLSFFQRLQKEQPGGRFLSDHPDNAARIEMAQSFPVAQPRPLMSPVEWKILQAYGCGD
jgi:predicted Zn-dependent protease